MEILIIEDEQHSATRLKKMILEYDQGASILDTLDSIEDSVSWFRTHKEPDLVFLDIQLADGNSFTIFEEINLEAPVIFTTAYNEYAIKAFKLNSIDYLLKPINKEQLVKAIKKYKKIHKVDSGIFGKLLRDAESIKPQYLKRMMIRIGATIKSIEIEKTAYFYIQDKITFSVMYDGSRYPVDNSLENLEMQLDPERFFRINRQFIISYQSLQKMINYSKSRIKIILTPPCEIEAISSSEKTPLFRDWLNGQSSQ